MQAQKQHDVTLQNNTYMHTYVVVYAVGAVLEKTIKIV